MGALSKDKRDIYYRLAKEKGYRARSAFKLLQIDEKYNILSNASSIVDLCAAPGSWSQVLASSSPNSKIVAVDLQPMAPIPNVHQIKGDITSIETATEITSFFNGNVDLVVCDGAPDVTGLHDVDEYIQSQLIVAALNISTHVLKRNGDFVCKVFRGKEFRIVFDQLRIFFDLVECFKPDSSRNSSIEAFMVCRGYNPPEGYTPTMCNPYIDLNGGVASNYGSSVDRVVIPFVACGDLSGFDCETFNEFQETFDIVQKPTEPFYKAALEMKRGNKL